MQPVGIRNNNPLNIKATKRSVWLGEDVPPKHKTFETFSDPIMGMRAAAVLILNHFVKKKANTIRKLIKIWAPPGVDKNPDKAYINKVAKDAGVSPDEVVDFSKYSYIFPVFVAMIAFENGAPASTWYSTAQINKALSLAGVGVPTKPLSKSRTIKGSQAVAVGGAVAVVAETVDTNPIIEAVSAYPWLVDAAINLFTYAPWVALGLGVAGLGYIVWARIDDHNKGER